MKRTVLFTVVLACLLSGTVSAQQPDLFSSSRDGVVFVDLARVFNGFYKSQLAKSRIDIQQKDIDVEKQVMIDELTLIDEDVDVLKKAARDITLSEEIRDGKRILYENRLMDFRKKQKEIEEFTTRRQQQLQLQANRMSQKVMDEIRQTVVEYAKSNGLMAVIDSSSRRAVVGVFIYTHPDVDITEDILNVLNSKRPDVMDGSGLFDDDEPESDEMSENPSEES